jgi:threonine dehydrogenase-like Zn-dependent dehydrogenase
MDFLKNLWAKGFVARVLIVGVGVIGFLALLSLAGVLPEAVNVFPKVLD